jgi:hypothetical protein
MHTSHKNLSKLKTPESKCKKEKHIFH